ncbi:MAG: aminotransferase class IV [Kiritimatiellia bacterium]|jgi:branched-chain amino acid aminotransferase|nr:aminotransferase class IV [Kiritimatiellia bacterium]MDP6631181.1 aminotransferase class IV [Kiritimatiellia bacterium]MDP6809797.1 aminotransferase class IV [Kiritimatiellia bacterium]MDP7025093.1 aminotransferase class IV [Kiritimatiellia bacterium]
MTTPLLTIDSWVADQASRRQPWQAPYRAMYASVWGGIVTDPGLMLVPIDDHMVHRGDAVFDTCKCVGGALYNLGAHLDRLEQSAAAVHMEMPCERDALVGLIRDTVRAGGKPEASVRVLVSRGPGSFGCSPYDCPAPALYIMITDLPPSFMETHPQGATTAVSAIPAKPPFFAGVKNCNYLPNVLMKKEAKDRGVDFVISLDDRGFLAEGPTENVGIVEADGTLAFPTLDNILPGTTMLRVVALARELTGGEGPSSVVFRDITVSQAGAAAEMLIVGTTPNVTAVRQFNDRTFEHALKGPVFRCLTQALETDILTNDALRTAIG